MLTGAANRFHAEQQEAVYLGEIAQHRVTVGDMPLKVFELNPRLGASGGEVVVTVDAQDVVVLSD
ncbi:MAG: hypothetical protein AAFY08_16305 [Planctomycetota bacterium]